MAPKREERRLAAILAADMVGYSRLMEADERGTIARQKSHRIELLDPEIAAHSGRIVKTTGDGLLVEFASVVDATECAVAIQRAMTEREAAEPEERRIQYRIGINLGDIIIDSDDILGEGVNVAARLEALSEPGGICVSGTVHEHVAGKIDLSFDDMGEQTVKNIKKPVRVYRARLDAHGEGAEADTGPALKLPDKPSIAVLPFDNMSGDSDQEYFADGIAEDIITELSRQRWLFVIARNSSFTYKGKSVDVKKIARELGVQYVLEGSVRKASNRVRISAQLVDATTGNHAWAERYDRELEDIFAVQDEITANIVGSLAPEFASAEMRRAEGRDPKSFSAWDYVMQARWHSSKFSRESSAEARHVLDRAIELDPKNASALTFLAVCHIMDAAYGWSDSAPHSYSEAYQTARRAVAIDDHDAEALMVLGLVEALTHRHDEGIANLERAVDLNPSLAMARGALGLALSLSGQPEPAIVEVERAIRLSPHDPLRGQWSIAMASAESQLGRFEAAVDWARRAVRERPDAPSGHRGLAANLALADRIDEAQAALQHMLRLMPGATISSTKLQLPFADKVYMERFLDGLRKAGLPE